MNIFKTYDFFKESSNDDIKMKSMKMNLLKDASVVLQASSWGREAGGGKAGRPVYLGTWRARIHRRRYTDGRLRYNLSKPLN